MQKLMRHSTPILTADLYTHILMSDKADELKEMPTISIVAESEKLAATGACDSAPDMDKNPVRKTVSSGTDSRADIKTYRDKTRMKIETTIEVKNKTTPCIARG